MTALAAQTPSGGWRSGTTGKVRIAGTIIDIIDKLLIHSFFYKLIIFCSGLELKHWKEMVENPRRPIVHWHVLKVGDVDNMICVL